MSPWTTPKALIVAGILMPLTFSLAGCGGPGEAPPGTVASKSHGGTSIEMPDGVGFAEILVEPPEGKATKKIQGVIVAYFVKPDGSGPLSPSPTAVAFKPAAGGNIPLNLNGEQFKSAPGPYNPGRPLDGELSLTVDGKPVNVTFATR